MDISLKIIGFLLVIWSILGVFFIGSYALIFTPICLGLGFLLMGQSDIIYELRLLNKKKTQD